MRALCLTIAGVLVASLAAAVVLSPSPGGERRLEVAVVRVEPVQEAFGGLAHAGRRVALRLRNRGSENVCFFQNELVQVRVAHRWCDPDRLAQLECTGLPPLASSDELVVPVPIGADALRLSLEYRFGASPYCRTYGFLLKHGLFQAFPKACKWAMQHFPRCIDRRRVALEVGLPDGL